MDDDKDLVRRSSESSYKGGPAGPASREASERRVEIDLTSLADAAPAELSTAEHVQESPLRAPKSLTTSTSSIAPKKLTDRDFYNEPKKSLTTGPLRVTGSLTTGPIKTPESLTTGPIEQAGSLAYGEPKEQKSLVRYKKSSGRNASYIASEAAVGGDSEMIAIKPADVQEDREKDGGPSTSPRTSQALPAHKGKESESSR